MASPPLDPEHLLAEDQFVRGLARQLVSDAHGAEDLAQQTWVAALRQPLVPRTSMRGWLAAVVRRLAGKHARSERRERARQAAAARTDETPSTAEIVAREAVRAEVVRAVLALDEPYRATVLLRWFDNLPPRAIARRLGVPVETVRTRLKRGMALLRARLDKNTDGGRPAWCALLLPFARSPVGPVAFAVGAAQGTIAGILFMTTKAKVATALVALGGILWITAWAMFAPPAEAPVSPPPQASAHTEAASLSARAHAAEADPVVEPRVDRQAVEVPPAPTTGSLLVHAVWGDDQHPAAGIDVRVYRSGADELFDEPNGRSDATGSVLFEELAPGNVYPSIERADNGGFQKAVIVAGQRTEVTLEAKMGMNAKGRVVDADGAPVADAEVVVSGWGGGKTQTLGQSGADGTFLLRAIGTHCHIGARKQGFVPSSMRQFTAADGATVDFTIVLSGPGASLEGVVLDSNDRPVAGAVVRAGEREQKNHKLPDGATAMAPQAEQCRTDEAGRFRFASVVPGTVPVAARARGLAPWHDDVEVRAGSAESLTIRLQAGVTVFGTVRDTAGTPLAKVGVSAGDHEYLGGRSVATAADGTYRIDGLATGKLAVSADDDQRGKASASFEVVAGEKRRWDPVLSAGLQLRGRVLDQDGKPIASVTVEGQLERGSRDDHWHGMVNTDADGRFTLVNCKEGSKVRLSFRRKSTFPELVMPGLLPTAEEIVVRMPKEAWVYIQGTVLGPDGEVLPNVHISPFMKVGFTGSPAVTADGKTGGFRYGPYPPGTYSMRVAADGFPEIRLAERALGPDEVWDVGTLRFQRGGTLAVQLVAGTELPVKATLPIHDAAGEQVDRLDTSNGAGRSGPLVPGDYSLQVGSDQLAAGLHAFTIRAGSETRLDIPVQTGVATAIEFTLPDGVEPRNSVLVVLRDPQGAVVWRGRAWGRAGKIVASPAVTPGDYTIEATCEDLRANGTISVAAPGPAQATVALRKP